MTILSGVNALAEEATRPTSRIPLPEGVIEHVSERGDTGIPCNYYGGFAKLSDGRLMFVTHEHLGLKDGDPIRSYALYSSDGGKTWSDRVWLDVKIGIGGMIQLKSGALAAYGAPKNERRSIWDAAIWFSRSDDEGKTWSEPVKIHVYPNFVAYLNAMRELPDGRLLIGGYWERDAGRPDTGTAGSPDTLVYTQYGWCYWKGRVMCVEGHRGPEMGFALAYISDDGGSTWHQMKQDVIFGWFDEKGMPNGGLGITSVFEPTMAPTKDGRVMMLMRSKVGRLLQTYSRDRGESWNAVLPTELAASQTTPQLISLPKTGDLLCVWNQTSNEEIRRGFGRGRLTAAISRDDGRTWENFKTLELQVGMSADARIQPEYPIESHVEGRAYLGEFPDEFMTFTQPSLSVVGDQVFIRYGRTWLVPDGEKKGGIWPDHWPQPSDNEARHAGEYVLRIYPIEWFYTSK